MRNFQGIVLETSGNHESDDHLRGLISARKIMIVLAMKFAYKRKSNYIW